MYNIVCKEEFMDTQLKKGLLDICVLKCLVKKDSYGYDLISNVSEIIEISESTLYPILRRLEDSSYLETYKEEHSGRLRKYYRITLAGKNRLREFKEEAKKVLDVYEFILKEDEK